MSSYYTDRGTQIKVELKKGFDLLEDELKSIILQIKDELSKTNDNDAKDSKITVENEEIYEFEIRNPNMNFCSNPKMQPLIFKINDKIELAYHKILTRLFFNRDIQVSFHIFRLIFEIYVPCLQKFSNIATIKK